MMSDNETPEPAEETNVVRDQREALKRKDAEIAGYRSDAIATHLGSIGLEAGKGLGKAIANGYDGETTADAIAAFAKTEYDHEYVPQQAPAAQQMQAAQQRADGFGQASSPMQPASSEDIVRSHDQRLASPDATRKDAQNALEAKVQHYLNDN